MDWTIWEWKENKEERQKQQTRKKKKTVGLTMHDAFEAGMF